jgi:beta-lactamase class A
MQKLQKTLNQYLAAQDGTYGVFVIDLTTGQSLGINSDTVFPAASTFKLPMSLYILNLASQGKVDLNEQLAYQESDYEDGTGILQDSISVGDTYPIKELIKLAITQSDNIATHMLLDRFGIQNVYDYMHQLGGQVTEYDDETIGTTPKEMARYMRSARGTKAVTDPALRQFLIDCLENTAFVDRTAAGVPEGVAVAHKIGTLPNVVNDVALVLAPDHPFIISAFSKDVNDDQAPQVITDVTRQVYDFLTNS